MQRVSFECGTAPASTLCAAVQASSGAELHAAARQHLGPGPGSAQRLYVSLTEPVTTLEPSLWGPSPIHLQRGQSLALLGRRQGAGAGAAAASPAAGGTGAVAAEPDADDVTVTSVLDLGAVSGALLMRPAAGGSSLAGGLTLSDLSLVRLELGSEE